MPDELVIRVTFYVCGACIMSDHMFCEGLYRSGRCDCDHPRCLEVKANQEDLS